MLLLSTLLMIMDRMKRNWISERSLWNRYEIRRDESEKEGTPAYFT
jgi:hypothetical protein